MKKGKQLTNKDLPAISQKDFVEIIEQAPEVIQTASSELKNAFVALETAERALSESSYRFFVFEGKDGEEITADLKSYSAKGFILRHGGKESDVKKAQRHKEMYVMPLIEEIKRCKEVFNDIYRKEMLSSVTPEIMSYIVKLFGEMNGVDDVQKILKEEKKIKLTQKELQAIFAKKKAEIESKRAVFLASSNQYKVATEAGRLQIINTIIIDLQHRYQKYLAEEKEEKALIFEREIRNMLEQARKEVKGNELKLTVDGKIDIVATLHGQENVSRVFRTLPINSIIIGLVAAKSGLDPTVLVHQLATSYYKDFNGFNKTILGREKIMLPGDLIRAANWEELEKQNQKFLDEMTPYEVQEATYIDDERKASVKDRLKALRLK
ncbi:MAG: hypothetical protein SOY17_10090 [Evtepia sp.]|nr:hypothetical protein [Evtepia sp.]